jgi:hypothetical protein
MILILNFSTNPLHVANGATIIDKNHHTAFTAIICPAAAAAAAVAGGAFFYTNRGKLLVYKFIHVKCTKKVPESTPKYASTGIPHGSDTCSNTSQILFLLSLVTRVYTSMHRYMDGHVDGPRTELSLVSTSDETKEVIDARVTHMPRAETNH